MLPRTERLLILGAFLPEIEAYSGMISPELRDRVSCHLVGIGIAESAAATARLLLEYSSSPRTLAVLFVGSCGSTGEVLAGSIVNVSATSIMDSALEAGKSYLPSRMTRRYLANAQKVEQITAALSKTETVPGEVYSPLSITSDADLGQRLARKSAANFENLELFGVAAACSLISVAWNALCPVTNQTGSAAHADWMERHAALSGRLAALLSQRVVSNVYFSPDS